MSKKSAKQSEQKKTAAKPKKPKSETWNSPWYLKNWGAFFLITLVSFVLYSNTLSFDYAADDSIVIQDNMFTQQGTKGIKDILTHDTFLGFFKVEKNLVAGGRYRPLSLVTFAMEKEYFGDSPHTSHLINAMLYALCGIFIYLMLKQLFHNAEDKYSRLTLLPLLTTLLFIAHPMHTEAVANIKGRDEIMSMLFCSVGTYLLLQYMDGARSTIKMILSFVCFFLGMMSKENAVTFFLVVPLMWWLFRKTEMKDLIRLMIPVGIAAVLFLILRQSLINTSLGKEVTELMNNPFYGMSSSEKYATIIYTFGKYLMLLLLPIKLTNDYYPFVFDKQSFGSPAVLIALAVVGASIFFAIRLWKREPIISFCILFFALTFSVVSNLVFPVGTFMSERLVFMPSLGFCLLIAFGIYKFSDYLFSRESTSSLQSRPASNHLALFSLSVFSLIMLLYSGRTIARNPAWENNYALFTTDIHNSPNSAKANNAAGGVLIDFADKETNPAEKKKMTDQAKIYLKRAIELYPQFNNAYLLLGNAYFKGDKDYPNAFHYYKEALVIYPNYTLAYNNMKILMGNWKDYNAQRDSIRAFKLKSPNGPVPYYFMGSLYENTNKPDSALMEYKRALQLVPGFAEALLQAGMIYGKYFNQLDTAISYLQKSIASNPDIAEAYENLGTAFGIKGNLNAAIAILNDGLKRFPNDANLYVNLGVSYQQAGNSAEAEKCFAKSKQLNQNIQKQ